MKTKSLTIHSLKFIFKDIIFDFFYWPIWWYSKGIKKSTIFFVRKFLEQENFLGVRIWLKNIFVPMFGQYDWQGRVVSFIMRVVNVIARSILLVFWTVILLILYLFWLLVPLYATFQILRIPSAFIL